jgi:serine/threonine protein kinase
MDMSDEAERREGLGVTTLREIALLKRLKHPNVVELLDVEYDGQTDLKLIFEYCENGDLHKYMWAKQ